MAYPFEPKQSNPRRLQFAGVALLLALATAGVATSTALAVASATSSGAKGDRLETGHSETCSLAVASPISQCVPETLASPLIEHDVSENTTTVMRRPVNG